MKTENNTIRLQKKKGLGLKIHFLVYICVNLLLFFINLAVGYRYPWHFWPLLGWGIFLGCHLGVYLTLHNFNDTQIRGVLIHASVTISINIALLGMNILAGYNYPWHLWALIGLGLPLGIHYSVILVQKTVKEGIMKGLSIHGGVYLSVNIALFFINVLVGLHSLWFMWPLLAWFIAFGIHASTIISIKRLQKKSNRGLFINGSVLVLISLFLLWIDFRMDHHLSWIIFVIIPLGLVWLNHYIIYLICTPQFGHEDSLFTRMQNKVRNHIPSNVSIANWSIFRYTCSKIIFWNHLIIYLLVNSFLVVINEINSGVFDNPWSLWSILSWGNAVIWHAYFVQIWKKRLFAKKITIFSTIGIFFAVSFSLVVKNYYFSVYSYHQLTWAWWAIAIAFGSWFLFAYGLSHLPPIRVLKKMHLREQIDKKSSLSKNTHSYQIDRFCPKCGEKREKTFQQYCEYCGEKFGMN